MKFKLNIDYLKKSEIMTFKYFTVCSSGDGLRIRSVFTPIQSVGYVKEDSRAKTWLELNLVYH